jgi:hypothetical protein
MANDKDFKAKNRVTALAFYEKVTALTSASGAMTADLSASSIFTSTLTEDTEVTLSNPPASGSRGYATFVLKADSGTHKIYFDKLVNYDTAVYDITTDQWVITLQTSDGGSNYSGAYAVQGAA